MTELLSDRAISLFSLYCKQMEDDSFHLQDILPVLCVGSSDTSGKSKSVRKSVADEH